MLNDDVGSTVTHVYKREYTPNLHDTFSIIVNNISTQSRVLDVGTGTGALGGVLANQKKCHVDGVTYNDEEAQLAAPNYMQMLVIDLERDDITLHLPEKSYDFIVCADVLEHLRNAKEVLRSLRRLLRDSGQLIVSVPNVTHMGVILGLTAGRFIRTHEGLLDSTHVHFLDRQSLRQLIHDSGYIVLEEAAVRKNIADTEFASLEFDNIPPSIQNYLLTLPDADIYQFVWSIKVNEDSSELIEETGQNALPLTPKIELIPKFKTQIYFNRGSGFSELDSLTAYGRQVDDIQLLSYWPVSAQDIQSIRIDFADRPGYIEFIHLHAYDKQGQVIWCWRGEWATTNQYNECAWTGAKGCHGGQTVALLGNDPWVSIEIEKDAWSDVGRIELGITSPKRFGTTDWPSMDMHRLQKTLRTVEDQLHELCENSARQVKELSDQLSASRNEREKLSCELATFQNQLSIAHSQIEKTKCQLEEMAGAFRATEQELLNAKQNLSSVLNSTSWRMTAGFRWLFKRLQ